MAAITKAEVLYREAGLHKTVLFRLVGINSGDTFDPATVGGEAFKKVQGVAFVSSTQAGVVPTMAGTVITMTLSGMANECVYMLVTGVG